jgi:hypothetical protein
LELTLCQNPTTKTGDSSLDTYHSQEIFLLSDPFSSIAALAGVQILVYLSFAVQSMAKKKDYNEGKANMTFKSASWAGSLSA